jgi:hypothetical protein
MNADSRRDRKSGDARVSGTSSIFANTASPSAAKSSPVPACFEGSTLVHTIDGLIEISEIGVGVPVLSRNEATGEQAYREVLKTFAHEDDRQLYRIDYVPENGDTDAVSATPEHPFWVKGVGWTQVGHLKSGDVLEICDPSGEDDRLRPPGNRQELALSGGRWLATVVSVTPEEDALPVFNLEVDEFHTYFVGTFGVWVHNTAGTSPATVIRESSLLRQHRSKSADAQVAGLPRSPPLRLPMLDQFFSAKKKT